MSAYKHGAYAELVATQDYISPSGVSTLPVYFGLAPVHQLTTSPSVGEPILVSSYNEAIARFGYSEDWQTFTLCEAVYAHFRNGIQSIGPIVLVNALDPVICRENIDQVVELAFSKGRAEIADPLLILNTLSIEGKELGKDYTATWSTDGSKVVLGDLTGGLSSVSVTYRQTTPSTVSADEIIQAVQTALPLVYQTTGMVPTLLAAPGWSSQQKVAEVLTGSASQINGHWYAFVALDLPATSAVGTPDKAITAKREEGLGSALADLQWPCARKGNRVFHLSTLSVVTMQRVDYQNDNIPFESPSNKAIDADGLCLADGTPVTFDKDTANRLNAAGIQTGIFWGGAWVLWGSQTSLFQDGTPIVSDKQFDATVRMTQYLANDFQSRYGALVDRPMRRSLVDTVLNDTKQRLDGYVSNGQLLHGTISFLESSNQEDDMVAGDFVFDIAETTTPPAKSITARLRWTSQGLSVLTGGEQI